MSRSMFVVLAVCGLIALGSLSSATAAPVSAPPSAESLVAMKAHLVQLKNEAAALEAKIAAAEAPPAGTEPALVTALNAMPKNLWPADSDSQVKESLRDKWLADNIKPGTSYAFTGLVTVVSPTTINAAGKPPVDAVNVVLDCGKFPIWGKEKSVRVIANLENVSPADTLDWGDKKYITFTGTIRDCRTGSNPVEAWMNVSQMKK